MDSITQGLLDAGHMVRVLSIATETHADRRAELPASYLEATAFETVRVDTRVRVIPAALNLLRSESYNISRFNSDEFRQKLVWTLRREEFDIVDIETLPMMNYVADVRWHSAAKIVYRAHNVEHQLWSRLAAGATGLKKLYLQLLAKRLETYERAHINSADGIAAITREDVAQLKAMGCVRPISHFPFALPPEGGPPGAPGNVFFHLGTMVWEPNIEAVRFLTGNIWPRIREQRPDAVLRLAGRRMPESFRSENGVQIDGEVPDAKSYMCENGILLAPLLSGGGMRIKLIEAMALGRAVVSTPLGLEGIPAVNGVHAAIAETAHSFAAAAINLYDNADLRTKMGWAARQMVIDNFGRSSVTEKLTAFFRQIVGSHSSRPISQIPNPRAHCGSVE